jgi:hypothetical protein
MANIRDIQRLKGTRQNNLNILPISQQRQLVNPESQISNY